jgi:hypothetical protein
MREQSTPGAGPSAASRSRKRWTEERVRQELREFLAGRDEWPSAADFALAGRRSLRDMVYRFGGSRRWARELGVSYPERRPGYAVRWTDARIRDELAPFLASRRMWPSRKEFEAAGLKPLRDALGRTGGIERWSAEFGLALPDLRRGSHRVFDAERIEVELRRFVGDREDWPTKGEFRRAGLDSLLNAIYRHGGGTAHWADRLGLRRRPDDGHGPPHGRYWTDERIEAELRAFTDGARSWPGSRAFQRAGQSKLYRAASLYGGISYWRRRLAL